MKSIRICRTILLAAIVALLPLLAEGASQKVLIASPGDTGLIRGNVYNRPGTPIKFEQMRLAYILPSFFEVIVASSVLGPLDIAVGEKVRFKLNYRILENAPKGCFHVITRVLEPRNANFTEIPKEDRLSFLIVDPPSDAKPSLWTRFKKWRCSRAKYIGEHIPYERQKLREKG